VQRLVADAHIYECGGGDTAAHLGTGGVSLPGGLSAIGLAEKEGLAEEGDPARQLPRPAE